MRGFTGLARASCLLALSVLAAGCTSLADQDQRAKGAFLQGRYAEAADLLDSKAETHGRDELLFLLDRGTILHSAGRYEESNRCFQRAGEIIEDLDVISISEQAGTFLINETVADYRGEDYERVLIPIHAALNYADLGKPEEALVECRRCQHILQVIADKRGIDYQQNAFARYLSGLMYEIQGQPNDAFIEYVKVTELDPGFATAQDDVLRLARRLQFTQELEAYAKKFGHEAPPEAPGAGTIVILYECGLAPQKIPDRRLPIMPTYMRRPGRAAGAEVVMEGQALARTSVLNDVEATMVRTLDDRAAALLAKRAASIAAKEVAAYQIEKKHGKTAGAIAQAAILLSESPDLRGWFTAPASLQVARIEVPAGTHDITLRFLDPSGQPTGVERTWPGVTVAAGKIALINFRTVE